MNKNKTSNKFKNLKMLLLIIIVSMLGFYEQYGDYTLTVTSYGYDGSSDTKSIDISLSSYSEPPDITLLNPEINGYTVNQNGVVIGAIKPLRFDWGDREVTESWFPGVHRYKEAGTYTITVTAYGKEGTKSSASKMVTVLETNRGTVDGYVIDALLGTGIEKVEVHGASHTTYTDSSGYYKLENLSAGEHRFHFSKYEYYLERPRITVIGGESIRYSTALKLEDHGHLRGRVINPTGEGVPGVKVSWPGTYSYNEISTVTDSGGNYLLKLIPVGTRTFMFGSEGSEIQILEMTIVEGVFNTLDVTLNITPSPFNFKRQLSGEQSTISVWVEKINKSTGEVTINGFDARCPQIPFTWDWGDRSPIYDDWFFQSHTYADITQNYVVKVTAHYADGTTDSAEIGVRFVPPTINNKIDLPPEICIKIPDHEIDLSSEPRLSGTRIPSLTYFDYTYFENIPRSTIEYVLSVAASFQKDFVNNNVFKFNESFEQVLMKDYNLDDNKEEGMYSLWYTEPVCFVSTDYGLGENISWSDFFHEMGHNFTLNSPDKHPYGPELHGSSANALFSESMAQIFQHATAYEMINEFYKDNKYGLTEYLVFDIKKRAISTINVVKEWYLNYTNGYYLEVKTDDNGNMIYEYIEPYTFASWNVPYDKEKKTGTIGDETRPGFMTIAFKFFEHAEEMGQGYKVPLMKMMEFFQGIMRAQEFHENFKNNYGQRYNDEFRATFMVTALSYAFSTDLRTEFKELYFPISDETYDDLMSLVSAATAPANMHDSNNK